MQVKQVFISSLPDSAHIVYKGVISFYSPFYNSSDNFKNEKRERTVKYLLKL